MEFSARHHDTLVHNGIDRNEVALQAPLLADTMRKIVDAILDWKSHIKLSAYKRKKEKISSKEKKFPLPNIKELPHKERKHRAKDAFHDALVFRNVDLKHDRIAAACREIQWEYRNEKIYPEEKLWSDARMLVWAYFLFRKTDGRKSLISTFKTITKYPWTPVLEGSNILSALKSVLQAVERNTEIDYKKFTNRMRDYTEELLREYPDEKVKK